VVDEAVLAGSTPAVIRQSWSASALPSTRASAAARVTRRAQGEASE